MDKHSTLRKMLLMECADMPGAVEDWLKTEGGRTVSGDGLLESVQTSQLLQPSQPLPSSQPWL